MKIKDLLNDGNSVIDIRDCLAEVENSYRRLSAGKYLYNKVISYKGSKFDNEFMELIYATLDAWNMNSRQARLSEFETFKDSIVRHKQEIMFFDNLKISKINNDESFYRRLNVLYDKLELVATASRLVTFTKTMHFILPQLIVPVDRRYTLKFFDISYIPKNSYKLFREIHERFVKFSKNNDLSKYVKPMGNDITWLTTETKVIDNVVIGYQILKERDSK